MCLTSYFYSKAKTCILCVLWYNILERINNVNKLFQKNAVILKEVADHFKSLTDYLQHIRENFDSFETEGKELLISIKNSNGFELYADYRQLKKRKIKLKVFPGESPSTYYNFTAKDRFNIETYLPICDSLMVEMTKRSVAYYKVHSNFSFLFDVSNLNFQEKKNAAKVLVEKYPNDLEELLGNEIIQFHEHVTVHMNDESENYEILDIFKKILSLNCYPNVSIALRLYLTLACGVCESERSFSKMALIKNQKRAVMRQERLNALSLISIEHEFAKNINFEELINNFANSKVRKIKL